ncbi:YbaB/EbfC family nucleoid-associated protein [Aporhodopirellula aestuarii]|uniref:YbaB/EbfC family nucleoid-associated protein n=1 Tax=Aporhodopirellula aestuarii TaxID=2950107 RepID=A0ABT0U1D9_9BACT|nr:YbaB/EbfC family nucleoid-associated protein [Aporhodopirellula aestuarii]MCM2370596.1 YbaB/EbfC family nucleoid-associated protein [Aporhodopirellula aestuarii]
MFKGLGGLGNLGNIASMVGKLQDLPQQMQALNERMKSERVSASSPCGHVTVTMNGVGEVQSVDVNPQVFDDDQSSPAALGQSIQYATNAAGSEAKQLYASAVGQLANDLDLNIPGMDGLLSSLTGGNG